MKKFVFLFVVLFEEKDVAGKKMYGFQTPKKRSSMVQRATEIVNSPAFHTPKQKKNVAPTKTPRSVRSRLRKGITIIINKIFSLITIFQ